MTLERVWTFFGCAMFVCILALSVTADARLMRRAYAILRVPQAIRTYDCVAAVWCDYKPPKGNDRLCAARVHLFLATLLLLGFYPLQHWLCALTFLDFAMFLMLYATFMLKLMKPRQTVFARKA